MREIVKAFSIVKILTLLTFAFGTIGASVRISLVSAERKGKKMARSKVVARDTCLRAKG